MTQATNNKVVLAFSGGLDTTFCAIYLARDRGLEVHTLTVNTGGFSDAECQQIAQKAQALGVAQHTTIDATQTYYQEQLRYLLFGNVLKNSTYPLSVSAERICQATAVAQHTRALGAAYIAHGSTGAGNDQVRFDMIFHVLIPQVSILTPIRDLQLSRQAEIDYLQQHGISYNAQKARYSINQGLWGTSVGGAETLTSHLPLPEEAWPTPITKTDPETISLEFLKGEPIALNGQTWSPVALIQELQAIAQPFGIGRDIHVGDTIIGIKGRVGFEAAAPILLIKAHHALEKHTLTKWQLQWKDQLGAFYGNFLHEGLYHDPVMRDLEAFLDSSQARVSGTVHLRLYPHRFEVLGIESPFDLMSDRFGSYGEMNKSWTGEDVKGFSKIFGNQIAIWQQIHQA
ncbi:MAG: argininosuccinate synthase [Bernardetiaceae bacterium]